MHFAVYTFVGDNHFKNTVVLVPLWKYNEKQEYPWEQRLYFLEAVQWDGSIPLIFGRLEKREVPVKMEKGTNKADMAPTRLKMRRMDAGYTQKELAGKSGLSLRTIQQYEQRTKDINRAAGISLQALARTLDCRIEDLLEEET